MATDYESICEENLARYGYDTALFEIVRDLYSKRTHFVYELIQNAQDAGATKIEMELLDDRLVVTHDGRPFTEEDVRGVCGVGKSTKQEDLTAIGRFGVGFKSVYVYTTAPEIQSGEEAFRIRNFVHPERIESQRLQGTRISIPFDFEQADPARCCTEIEKEFEELSSTTLLFLSNVDVLVLRTATFERELRKVRSASTIEGVDLVKSFDSRELGFGEDWLLWRGPVEDHPHLAVEIAVPIEVDDGQYETVSLYSSPLVAFFETEKETNLPFLIQAPFRTTPARDNIPAHDVFNKRLLEHLAELMSCVLVDLAGDDLLTAEFINRCGADSDRFAPGTMFEPFRRKLVETLRDCAVLPKQGGGFATATELALTTDRAVRAFATSELLAKATDVSVRYWADSSLNTHRVFDLVALLTDELDVPQIGAIEVLNALDTSFLVAQSDEWIVSLYEFGAGLAMVPGRFKAVVTSLIRLEDGTHVPAFDGTRRLAYLPDGESNRPTVRASVVTAGTVDFLKALGVEKPNVVDDVLTTVLPRYAQGEIGAADETLQKIHLSMIERALATANGERKRELEAALSTTHFVPCTGGSDEDRTLQTPAGVFEPTAELKSLLRELRSAQFVADFAWFDALEELGAVRSLQVQRRPAHGHGYIILTSEHGYHRRGVDGFDPKAWIPHIRKIIEKIDHQKALAIWDILRRSDPHAIMGEVETSGQATYKHPSRSTEYSELGKVLREAAWLPNRNGDFLSPSKLSLTDLPSDFVPSVVLESELGMQSSSLSEAASELGLGLDLLLKIKDDPTAIAVLQKHFAASKPQPIESVETGTPLSYRESLREASDVRDLSGPIPDHGDLTQRIPAQPSQMRQERERSELAKAVAAEPHAAERVHRGERTVWEARNPEVRAFLEAEYGGQCQICSDGFVTVDGTPYFEAIYLVSRKIARAVDRPGNAMALCPMCAAKFRFARRHIPDLVVQVESKALVDADGRPQLELSLDGEHRYLTYTPNHFLKLEVLVQGGDG